MVGMRNSLTWYISPFLAAKIDSASSVIETWDPKRVRRLLMINSKIIFKANVNASDVATY